MCNWIEKIKTFMLIVMLAVGTAGVVGTIGCEDDGPMEEAGEELDEAGEEIDEAGEEIADDMEN
jgi:hypothetical protein